MRHALLAVLSIVLASCGAQDQEKSLQAAAGTPAQADQDDNPAQPETPEESSPMKTDAAGLYDIEAQPLDETPADLAAYSGKVTLVVNVASRCGYTRQYAGLQKLHEELSDRGFAVLAFPSNEFGGQEPGSPQDIREFCTSKFDVGFPMFAKSEVKPGPGQSPVYAYLQQETDEVPGWNFCKYLVGKDGRAIHFFKSSVEPDSDELRQAIEEAIG